MRPLCHLSLAPGYRGGERQLELLVRDLAGRGRRQRLVVRKGHSLVARCSDVDGLEIREVAANPVAAGLAVRGSALAHAHEGRTAYSGLVANVFFGIPYVFTRRVIKPRGKSWLRNLAYGRASKLVGVSSAVVQGLRDRQIASKAIVIPDAHATLPVDEEEVSRIRARYRGKTLIGHVGALGHSHKGQMTIIEVARVAADRHPDWHFLLCGDGKDEERFREEIGILPNIELVGWVDNVGDYLAALDLFVYPSLHEALGSTLLDAMQLGLPIVATNVGGIPELVEDGVNGRLIEPENSEQLLAGIQDLLADDAGRAAMRERSIEKSSHYDATRMADAYETVYREIETQV
jgi:glycosyltransferase involved in cell wall biosynthesis